MKTRITIVGSASLIALASSIASAQSVSFALARGDASRSLELQSGGFTAALVVPLGSSLLSLSVDRLTGDANATGTVCVELIDPVACPTEPYAQTSRLTTVGVGIDLRLYRTRYAALTFRPQLLLGQAKDERLGHETGNALSAKKMEMGVSFGAEVGLTPTPRLPIDFIVGGAFRNLWPAARQADGFTPFETRFSSRTIYAGVAFTRRRERINVP